MSDASAMDGHSSGDDGEGGRRKGRLHLEVVQQLRRRILASELPPGTRLREVQLCSELGVSRTPLREAFRTLAAEGLVDLLPNRSVVVSQLDAPDLEHLVVVFADIEALAGALACRNVTDAQIAEMGALYGRMVEHFERGERAPYLEINQKIHRMTVEIAANPVLTGVWQSLLPRMQRARAVPNLDRDHWSTALRQHSRMFAALAARDSELLSRLTREHFTAIIPYLVPAQPPAAADD